MRESTKRHIFTAGRVGPVALFFILLHLGAHQQHNTPQTKFWFIDRLNILLSSSCIFYNRAIKLFNSRQMIVAITKVIRNFFSLKTNENERKKERRGAWSCIDFSKATAHIVSQKENIKCLGSGCAERGERWVCAMDLLKWPSASSECSGMLRTRATTPSHNLWPLIADKKRKKLETEPPDYCPPIVNAFRFFKAHAD